MQILAICNGNKLRLALDYLFFKMYDKEKFMNKYAFRMAKMNKKIKVTVCLLSILTLSGCYLFRPIDDNIGSQPQKSAPCAANDGSCIMPPEAANEYVNYQEVAADYREYGERTPRDQMIVQSGVSSNMSAAIPPTIEEEVTSYEEEIKTTENSEVEESVEENVNTNLQGSGEDPVRDWLVEEGQSLKSLLTQWSNESGWRLIWKSNRNYTVNAGAMFRGRFADVSAALVRAFGRARPAPIATFYKGNRVLVIETMEDENAY